MDVLTIEKVVAHKRVTPAQKLVLFALAVARPLNVASFKTAFRVGAVHANPILYEVERVLDSECAATPKSISEMTNYTIRQVRNILNALCDKGLIKRDGKHYLLSDDSGLLYVY